MTAVASTTSTTTKTTFAANVSRALIVTPPGYRGREDHEESLDEPPDRTTRRSGPMSHTAWPFPPPRRPMEAMVREQLPPAPGWVYEPKWDGFRILAWSGEPPRLDSRNGKTLLRYFPELVPALLTLPTGT